MRGGVCARSRSAAVKPLQLKQKAWRLANRASGRCWDCVAPAAPGHTICPDHLKSRALYKASTRLRRLGLDTTPVPRPLPSGGRLAPSGCLDCHREITSHDRTPKRRLLIEGAAFCDWCGRPRDPEALDEEAVKVLQALGHIPVDSMGQTAP